MLTNETARIMLKTTTTFSSVSELHEWWDAGVIEAGEREGRYCVASSWSCFSSGCCNSIPLLPVYRFFSVQRLFFTVMKMVYSFKSIDVCLSLVARRNLCWNILNIIVNIPFCLSPRLPVLNSPTPPSFIQDQHFYCLNCTILLNKNLFQNQPPI